MRSRWRGIVAAVSFIAFAMTVAATVRSYRIADTVYWANATEEPLTRSAERYAANNGFSADFVAHQRTWSVALLRGRVVLMSLEVKEPMLRSDRMSEQILKRRLWRHQESAGTIADSWQPGWFGRAGFAYNAGSVATRNADYRTVMLPLWSIVLLTAVAPLVWLKRVIRQWRRRRGGRCLGCGYDLRAHPAGRRCPECGMIPESAIPDYERPRDPAAPAAR